MVPVSRLMPGQQVILFNERNQLTADQPLHHVQQEDEISGRPSSCCCWLRRGQRFSGVV